MPIYFLMRFKISRYFLLSSELNFGLSKVDRVLKADSERDREKDESVSDVVGLALDLDLSLDLDLDLDLSLVLPSAAFFLSSPNLACSSIRAFILSILELT